MDKEQRDGVLRRMLRLADRKSNDSVKLMFLGAEEAKKIGKMDLSTLTELKRHGNGAVELKLVNRLEVLEKLYEMLKDGGDGELEQFLSAMGDETDGT